MPNCRDYINGASEFKVWSAVNSSAEYFDNFTDAFLHYDCMEGDKTLESVFTIIEEPKKKAKKT